jgi:hypothetical protein
VWRHLEKLIAQYMNINSPGMVFGAFAALPLFVGVARDQPANVDGASPPATKLEALARRTGTVLIRGATVIGTVTAAKGAVTVACKEDRDIGAGVREYGIAISIHATNQTEDAILVDYDELDGLLDAVDYLNKVDWSVTSLGSFRASFETKAGFRIFAFSGHRSSSIDIAVRIDREDSVPVILGRDQLAQFRGLLEQAKTKLEALMKKP